MTRLSAVDIAAGASSSKALRALTAQSGEVRCTNDDLHAKVYLAGRRALVTSANLTQKAIRTNIEAGVLNGGPRVRELEAWFQDLWKRSKPLGVAELEACEAKAAKLRRQFKAMRKAKGEHDPGAYTRDLGAKGVLRPDARIFLCNTDRRYDRDLGCENAMFALGYAASWTRFNWPSAYEAVQTGDVILAYARRTGVVGIGVATGTYETREYSERDWVAPREFKRQVDDYEEEWRVPTKWLAWDPRTPAVFRLRGGKAWRSPRGTFMKVDPTSDKFKGVVEQALAHFKLPYVLKIGRRGYSFQPVAGKRTVASRRR